MNILLIGVWSTLLILVVLVIILLIRTRSGRLSGSAGYGGGGLPRELREEMYRSRQETIGMVQSSVKNMGDMLSQAQREKIVSLCDMVHLNYPVDYSIARNGENLSGGEVAKICLIRELYREKSLLFIDEPMNDIDDRSEKDILNLLLHLDKTIIMVAHGLSSAEQFEQIVIQNATLQTLK